MRFRKKVGLNAYGLLVPGNFSEKIEIFKALEKIKCFDFEFMVLRKNLTHHEIESIVVMNNIDAKRKFSHFYLVYMK